MPPGDLCLFFSGCREQPIALAFFGQGGFATADQPLAEVTGSSYVGEVVLIEQRQLDRG